MHSTPAAAGVEPGMLAVTTRNRLRSPRFCLPMLRARRLIARQLATQSGLLRYASGIVSPTEFLTLTVWEEREAMRAFMQTGAHERLMWHFTHWTASFWAMRWDPATEGVEARPISPLVAVGLLPERVSRAGPLGPRPESSILEPRGCGLMCVTAWFDGVRGATLAWQTTRRLRSKAVRCSGGFDVPPQGLVIGILKDQPQTPELLAGADWVTCWQPAEYEIGHWDGLRLRT